MNTKLSGVNPHFGHIQTVNAASHITHLPIVDVKCNYVLPHTIEGPYIEKVLMPPNKVPQYYRYAPFHYYSNSAHELLEEDFALVSPSDQIWQKGNPAEGCIQWQENYVPSDHEIAGVGYKALTDYKTYAPNENGVIALIDIHAHAHVNDNGEIKVNFPKNSSVWIKSNLESVTQPYIWISGYNRHQVQAWLSEHNIQDPFLMRSMVELFLSGQPITRETLRSCGFRIENQNTANEHAYLPLPDGTYLQWKPGYNLDNMQAWEIAHPSSTHLGYQYPAKQTLSYLSVHQDPHNSKATDGLLNITDLRNAGFAHHPHDNNQNLWTRTMNSLNEQGQPLVHIWIPNKTRTQIESWHNKNRAGLARNYRLPAYLPGSEMDRALNATGHFGRFIVTTDQTTARTPFTEPVAKPMPPPETSETSSRLSQELSDSLARLKHYRSKSKDTNISNDPTDTDSTDTTSISSSDTSDATIPATPVALRNLVGKQTQTDAQPTITDTAQLDRSLPFCKQERFRLSPKGRIPTPPPFQHMPPTPPPFEPEIVIVQDRDYHRSPVDYRGRTPAMLEPKGRVPSPPLFRHAPPTPPLFSPSVEYQIHTETRHQTSIPLTKPTATQFLPSRSPSHSVKLQQAKQETPTMASTLYAHSPATQVRTPPSLKGRGLRPHLWTSSLRYDGSLAAVTQPRVRFNLPESTNGSPDKEEGQAQPRIYQKASRRR